MGEIDDEIYGLHCDIGRLETENADLRSENVKLRQELAILKASEQEKVVEFLRQDNIDWEDKYRALAAENAKLREQCSELLRMAESNDPDFLHWPEIHDELRKVGVEIVQLQDAHCVSPVEC